MISFKQFLSEQETNQVLALIEKDCGPFLEKSKRAGFLLRGVKGLAQTAYRETTSIDGEELQYGKKTVRADRRPLDISKETHDDLNNWFKETFGYNTRSESVFAYGEHVDIGDIKAYGEPCIIFPIGDMTCVWSPKIDDLWVRVLGFDLSSPELFARWIKEQGYTSSHFDEALQSKSELMIKCESYYAFPIAYMAELKKSLGFK